MKEYYCKLEDIKHYDNYEDFIKKFIKKNPRTYYVSSNNLQCSKGKNRSLTDIYYITKNRYPNITQDEVFTAIMKTVKSKNKKIIYFCTDIHKCVVLNNCFAEKNVILHEDLLDDMENEHVVDGIYPERLLKLATDAGLLL